MQWQPIETAPKDGTKILGYEDGNISMMSWHIAVGKLAFWHALFNFDTGKWPWNPTHWMLLPEPPGCAIKGVVYKASSYEGFFATGPAPSLEALPEPPETPKSISAWEVPINSINVNNQPWGPCFIGDPGSLLSGEWADQLISRTTGPNVATIIRTNSSTTIETVKGVYEAPWGRTFTDEETAAILRGDPDVEMFLREP